MTTTTMDTHGGHAPSPRSASAGRLKELAVGIGYLFSLGTAFTGLLALALVVTIGE